MSEGIKLRKGLPSDLSALKELFVGTITSVCNAHYSPDQIRVWTASIENEKRWSDMILQQYVLVAEKDRDIVGFATLHKGNYIDFFFVHKDHQGRGIARRLYTAIEDEAIRLGETEITSDISITARPFFEKQGFNVVKEQNIVRNQVELTNFKMLKSLG